ncbi:MAG: caspase family protein [Tannerella sp.]|jgi:uncharacterized caspase-like protein|nr:caspase family protein [Tannerella sp.]
MKFIKTYLFILFSFSAVYVQAELYAVIVGISKYKDSSNNLKFAATDAKLFYNLLTNGKQNPNIVLLLDENATRSNILNAIKKKYQQAKSSDHIIFYFSGHGVDGYFCQYDSNEDPGSLLKHKDIQNAFKMSNAGVKLCIADACHAGSIKTSSSTKKSVNFLKEYNDKSVSKNENIIVFMSSRGNQISMEDPFLRQGVFTHYLIKSFQGEADENNDQKVTAKEMYTYVRDNVSAKTKKRQIPIMFGRFSEDAAIVSYK